MKTVKDIYNIMLQHFYCDRCGWCMACYCYDTCVIITDSMSELLRVGEYH